MQYFSNKKGFSLIELLVVIAIIGILTAIVTANFTKSKAKARDAKRISDIAQIQLALEMAFDRCNAYPSDIDSPATTLCSTYTLGDFISKIPTDYGTAYTYATYATYATGGTDYVLRAELEEYSSALIDDIDGTVLSIDCDDSTKYYYCVQPK